VVLPDGLEDVGGAGMEILTTEVTGSKGSEVEAAPASQDVNDMFRTGGMDGGTGASVGVGAGVDTVDKFH
jgi:hypothetical protein